MGHDHAHHGHHHHGHGHGHAHAHGSTNARRLGIVLALTALFAVAEVVGGLYSHSLALIADAGHMLSDVAALGLSLFAVWIARRPATERHSYGYYRTEILAAAINAATLIAISIYVFVEAVQRMSAPPAVLGMPVVLIGAGGLLVNVIGLFVLSGGKDNLNVRGAWLHVATDALGSVGTIVAGAAVAWLGWKWADPVASVLIGILVLYSSISLLRESVGVLMEGTPAGIDASAVRGRLELVSGVKKVHDLHIWSITTGLIALSAHVDVDGTREDREVLPDLCSLLRREFNIDHVTLQLEAGCSAQGALHA